MHPDIQWPPIPANTALLEQSGRGLVILALACFLASVICALFKPDWPAFFKRCFAGGCVAMFLAFGLQGYLVMNRQYQFQYVYSHSDNWLSVGSRFAAIWGGQEGSFLLWAVMSGLFGLLSLRSAGPYLRWFLVLYSGFLGSLAAILAYESPFKLWIAPKELAEITAGKMPPDGAGLNPSLINYWMQIHPPTIFSGFGSLTVVFALAVAALIHGDLKSWLRIVRPWAILSATLLGVGLCMGGFWAYETLGWGGFWMWDPVENAALIPWLIMVAFIHGIFIQIARGTWRIANAVLGAMGLLSFIYGTFLTRSGFLGDTSVHSFASMDRGALYVLIGLGLASFAVTIVAALRRGMLDRKTVDPNGQQASEGKGFDRGSAYSTGIVFLTLLAIASGIGMSVPLIMSLRGQKPSVVEERLYNQVSPWFFVGIAFLMGITPYLAWRPMTFKQVWNRVSTPLALSFGFLGIGMFVLRSVPFGMGPEMSQTIKAPWGQIPTVPWILFLAWLCLFGALANLVRLVEVLRRAPMQAGAFLSHMGVVLTLLGLIVSRGFEKKVEFTAQLNHPGQALGYTVDVKGITGKNYMDRENRLRVSLQGRGETLQGEPTLFYTESSSSEEPSPTVRPFIFHRPLHDLYLTAYPLVLDATEPTTFKVGQRSRFEGHEIQYLKMEREGEAGMAGTRFVALLEVTDPNGHKAQVRPSMRLEDGRPRFEVAEQGEFAYELTRIDAADHSATIKLYYTNPVVPMELFYKPLPSLVWWGTGIMLIGGFLSAWYRRRNYSDAVRKGNA